MRRLILLLISLNTLNGYAQDSHLVDPIAVIARSYRDSIVLRWAPTDFSTWQLGNSIGYTIERYAMVRNSNVLNEPEKIVLTDSPLRPFPLEDWANLGSNKYAAVAAQALFGDNFEIDITQSDMLQVVNKVMENEQRYTFALFCADMSRSVAQASALYYSDTQIKLNERYLYRIVIYTPQDTLRGSFFIEPDFIIPLPRPENFKIEIQGSLANMQWNRPSVDKVFTAYQVERSTDNLSFTSISESPIVTVFPELNAQLPFEYYTDSLPDLSLQYYYRVRGITPFGEMSEPSEVLSVQGTVEVDAVPVIINGESTDNRTITIGWDFPEESNAYLNGFKVERSENPNSNFQKIAEVSPTLRTYQDLSPNQVNYYRIEVLIQQGSTVSSPVYLVQLIDSIPPTQPLGLKGTVNDYGHLTLTWQANSEKDMYGYRIYRANFESEELYQVTDEPVSTPVYIDTINLSTLNEHVYYKVMAIDRNQNHSDLSAAIQVPLPDRVRPQPPVFLPVVNNEAGSMLQWERSSSEDVVRYEVYRQRGNEKSWLRMEIVPAGTGDVYSYQDTTVVVGKAPNRYTVIAVDDAGLESEPTTPISGGRISSALLPPVSLNRPVIDRANRQVLLNWEYAHQGVQFFWIYKSRGDEALKLFKALPPSVRTFRDSELVTGERYTYRMLAIFENGSKSELSDDFIVNY